MHLRILLAISAALCCSAAFAGLKEGYAALIRKDYVAAMKEYRPLAEHGDAEAQYRVGRMYEFGQGVPQDKAQGIAWVRKAAAQNHADAQQELGFIYATGDGVKQDDVQAVEWFRKAAMQGNASAQYNLGTAVRQRPGGQDGLCGGDRLVAQIGGAGQCRRAAQARRRLPHRPGRGQGRRPRAHQRHHRSA
jgi:TPR repeat protein